MGQVDKMVSLGSASCSVGAGARQHGFIVISGYRGACELCTLLID